MIGNVGAVNGFVAQLFKANLPYLLKAPRIKQVCGLFVKVCDEPTGRVTVDGKLHKAFSDLDELNMKEGVEIAKKILVGAGVNPNTIAVAKGIGGHPGGTAAIGRVVDADLQTRVKNLYVCDNSIMPRSGGVPPVLTLIALAKKAARTTFLH
jgi:choline dehydrogenase-like flavoprotein